MKKLILIALCFVSLSGFAQIKDVSSDEPKLEEIGKVGGGVSAFLSSLSVLRDASGTNTYSWKYNNFKYTTITDIKSIVFTATEEELESLYKILKTQMSAEKGAEKKLVLGKQTINFTTTKNLGVVSLVITDLSDGGGYFMLTNKQLDKVFGK
jgi:hypothetical protein